MNMRFLASLAAIACAAATCAFAQVECKNHYILAEPCELSGELRWLDIAQPAVQHGPGHTATVLASGRVLVAGGGYSEQAAQVYDPVAGTWTMAGRMGVERIGHVAVLLQDGRVLVIGGDLLGASKSTAEIFDPETLAWTPASPLHIQRTTWRVVPRSDFSATRLLDGRVLVVGGNDPTWSGIDKPEIYDPASDTWQLAATAGAGRVGHSATLLPDGRVLVAGGAGDWEWVWLAHFAETYDPRTDSWARAGTGPVRFDHSTTALPDGTLIFAGGAGPDPRDPVVPYRAWWLTGVTPSSVIHDPRNGSWTRTGSMNSVADFHLAASLGDRVVAFMQYLVFEAPPRLETYSLASRAWSPASAAGTPPNLVFSVTKLDARTALFVGMKGAKLLAY